MIFLILLLFPLAEIYALYLFIDHYSFLDALLMMFFGVGFGLMIVRTQGQNVIVNLQSTFAQGKLPESYLIHRAMIMLGGFLIMVPGILTKMAGTMLVLPGFRHLAVWFMKWYVLGKISKGAFRMFMMGGMPGMGNMGGMGGFTYDSRSTNSEFPSAERDVVEIQPKKIEHTDK